MFSSMAGVCGSYKSFNRHRKSMRSANQSNNTHIHATLKCSESVFYSDIIWCVFSSLSRHSGQTKTSTSAKKFFSLQFDFHSDIFWVNRDYVVVCTCETRPTRECMRKSTLFQFDKLVNIIIYFRRSISTFLSDNSFFFAPSFPSLPSKLEVLTLQSAITRSITLFYYMCTMSLIRFIMFSWF